MYFSYDPEDGFNFHDTETEARKRATDSLNSCQDYACDDGWPENTNQVCWGRVVERVTLTRSEPADEDNENDFKTYDTYELKTIGDRTLREVLLEALSMACPDTILACISSLAAETEPLSFRGTK